MIASGSHFIGRPMPILHAHRRRVSAQYVDRSVLIGMGAETAMSAGKDRLALAALPIHGSAVRTRLRRIFRVDQHKRAAPFFKLVAEDGGETAPSLVQDASVQPGLLRDFAAWLFDSAASRSRHVADFQFLHDDRSETICNRPSGAMMPVTANTSSSRGKLGNAPQLPAPAVRPLLSSGENVLSHAMAPVNRFEAERNGKRFASGEHDRIGYAPVDSDRRANVGRSFVFNGAAKAYMPADRTGRNRHRPDIAAHWSGVAKLYPSDLRQTDSRPFRIDAPDFDFAPTEAETVVYILSAGRREFGAAGEEIDKRLVEIAQCLFLAGLRDSRYPVVLSSHFCKFTRLRHEAEAMFPAPYAPLLPSQIVDEPANAGSLPKRDFLFLARDQFESKSPEDHAADSTRIIFSKSSGREE